MSTCKENVSTSFTRLAAFKGTHLIVQMLLILTISRQCVDLVVTHDDLPKHYENEKCNGLGGGV